MSKAVRTERWNTAMELLNAVIPSDVSHRQLLQMSRSLCLSDFRFRPVARGCRKPGLRSVRDIQEFLSHRVRFIVMEDEECEVCELIVELIGEDRRPVGPGLHFDMRRQGDNPGVGLAAEARRLYR